MAFEGVVQGRFPFMGVMRQPNDVITADELAQCTPQVRDSLVSQKLIVLREEGDISVQDQITDLQRTVTQLQEDVARLMALASTADAPRRASGNKG